jgi:hypothetical protein
MPKSKPELMYERACGLVEKGDIDLARKILRGYPGYKEQLERKIFPKTEHDQMREMFALAERAVKGRQVSWINQLSRTGTCRYSIKVLKQDKCGLYNFFERHEHLLSKERLFILENQFFDQFINNLDKIKNKTQAMWAAYLKSPSSTVTFLEYLASENEPPPSRPRVDPPTRFERPWVI